MARLNECLLVWEDAPDTNKWSVMAFDAVVSEGHQGTNSVTNYPVSTGFKVSEHAIRHNNILTLNSMTTRLTMNHVAKTNGYREAFYAALRGVDQTGRDRVDYEDVTKFGRAKIDQYPLILNLLAAVPGGSLPLGLATTKSEDLKVEETYNRLIKLAEERTVVHVVTVRGVRNNCVIREWSTTTTVRDAFALPLNITLEQLILIDRNKAGIVTASTEPTDGDPAANQKYRDVDAVETSEFFISDHTYYDNEIASYADDQGIYIPGVSEMPDEYYAEDHRIVPFSGDQDVRFTYDGVEYTLKKIEFNDSSEMLETSLEWRVKNESRSANGIRISAGVNLVRQYNTGLPSLVAINTVDRGADPTDVENLQLYIIQKYEYYFTVGDVPWETS